MTKITKTHKPITDFTDDKNPLTSIIDRVAAIAKLDTLVKQQLDTPLTEHIHVANFRQGSLIIACESAVWATQLRYQQYDLLDRLRAKYQRYDIASIKCIIPSQQKEIETKKQVNKTLDLSPAAATMIASCAESIKDEGLKAALEKLAAHAEKKPPK